MTGKPDLPVLEEHVVRQVYLVAEDDIEVRLHCRFDGDSYNSILPHLNKCKMTVKRGNGLVRQETEIYLQEPQVRELAKALPNPLFITKYFTIFDLGNGLKFEFSSVDPNLETGFLYGEIEFPNIEAAKEYLLPPELKKCIAAEVTGNDTYQMKNYWCRTRLGK